MRLLDSSGGVPTLETTGLRGMAYKNFMDTIKISNGIILISGPTGSGKTRTLAGALAKLNKPTVNIITLENPVEIRIPNVTQVQINPDVGFTFALGLRSVLRQDPDIIMVGEIRDAETAKLAVEASLTGHLVLSTIHTNSASATIPRLIEMGIEPYLLASTIRVAVAQRLVRKVCPYCREAYVADDAVVDDIEKTLSSIKNFDLYAYVEGLCSRAEVDEHGFKPTCPLPDKSGRKKLYLYRGNGCERCNHTGYIGRTGIFEVLQVTDKIGQLTLHEGTSEEIEA
jgi:type II secretory ATPase GspE/PulE/Tfp pilus assembly ATPase PilB-like protein